MKGQEERRMIQTDAGTNIIQTHQLNSLEHLEMVAVENLLGVVECFLSPQ